jgi:diguanylate cyclase (GGDEF)-like protein
VTTRGWRILAATGAAAVVAFVALPGGRAGALYAVAAGALVVALLAVLVRDRARVDPAWWLLALGLASVVGSGLTTLPPRSALVAGAQVGLLTIGYLSFVAGGGRFIAVRTNLRDLDGILDTLILCCATGVVLWEFVSGPRLATGGTVAANAELIAFPLAQALVIAIAVRFMFWGTWRLVSGWLLFGATVIGSAANVGYVLSTKPARGIPHSWIGALWLLSALLVVLAAAHRSRPALTEVALPGLSRVPYARLAVMGVALVAAPVIVFQHAKDDVNGVLPAAGSLILTAMVVARLFRLVIEREQARGELAIRARQQAAVVALGERALAGSELARLFDEATRSVAAALHATHCGVFEPSGRQTLALQAAVGWDGGGAHRVTVSTAEPFFGVPMIAGAPGYVESDVYGGGRPCALLQDSQVVSGVSVPIGTTAERYGVLAVGSTGARRFSTDDVSFLRAVGNVLTTAIERDRAADRIRHATLHDTLTGLPNRVLLLDRLDSALSRANRMSTQVAVMAVDLDGLQKVNETFGHRAGDQLLAAVARRLRKALRVEDTLARLTGDEFVVVCERIEDLPTIALIAQRIVDTLGEPFVLDDGTTQISGSVGIAVGSGRGDDVELLLREADAAMHRAKQLGRARYEVARGVWWDAQSA